MLGDARGSEGRAGVCGVVFHPETLRRVGGRGDNWCMTWARDGAKFASMDDGSWLGGPHEYNNHLYRIAGGPDDFTREDVPAYPQFIFNEGGWFGYGLLSIDGALYSFVSKCPKNHWSGPFRGVKLLKSPDLGRTWFRVDRSGRERLLEPWDESRYAVSADEMFFLEESGVKGHGQVAYPFSFCAFVQNGQDNRAAHDDYIYVYAPEGARSHHLLLARAPRQAIGTRASWEYWRAWDGGNPAWTRDLARRAPVHVFPETDEAGHHFGWYSWLPSIVWNPGLQLYVMANGGTYAGHGLTAASEDYYDQWMHTESGSLGFWCGEAPWGPWRQFFYAEHWTVDDPANRTYQPKLSPKWISSDGKRMVLIWSDAMKDDSGRSHTVNYRWNQMEITIETEDASTNGPY
jgi:hypothetical protein